MSETIFQVDAFTSVPFKGNPAGVCILDHEPDTLWMQNIAMEMNLSETAFVFPQKNNHIIRFYTPEAEIELCGHATLSSAHILYETGTVKADEEMKFLSKAGELIIRKEDRRIVMNLPVYPVEKLEITNEFEIVTGEKPLELYKAGFGWTLALLKDESSVRNMKPDFQSMKNSLFNDLIVTAGSDDPEYDFCVRCFVPGLGINEDPVTGSAHCALVPFWSEKTGRKIFTSHQVSKREGTLNVALINDRVEVSGEAVTVLKAELFI